MSDKAVIGADPSGFINGMAQAGQAADKFHDRVNKAGGGITGLFKRTPEFKAQRAFTHFADSLASGDVQGAISNLTGHMSGFGLAAGVGIGVAIEVFSKLHDAITRVNTAQSSLNEVLLSPAKLVGAAGGVAGLTSHLQAAHKATEELQSASSSKWGMIAMAYKNALPKMFGGGGGNFNDTGASELAGVQSGFAEQRTTGSQLVKQENMDRLEAAAHARRESRLLDSPDDKKLAIQMATIEKIHSLEEGFSKKKAEILLQEHTLQTGVGRKRIGIAEQEFDIQLGGIKAVEAAGLKQINTTAALKDRDDAKSARLDDAHLAMATRIAALQHKGLAGNDLKRVQAAEGIKDLDEQIKNEPSDFKKGQLQLQRSNLINEAHALPADAAGPSNPFPFGTAANRGFDSEFGYQGFTKRHVEDSLGFGGLARGSIDRGESQTPEDALLKAGISQEEISNYKTNVGPLGGAADKDSAVAAAVREQTNFLKTVWAEK
jgi:hypothetical protein